MHRHAHTTRRDLAETSARFSLRAAQEGGAKSYLVGGAFSLADVSVLPRLLKAPINGILATPAQRAAHPAVVGYFERLRARPALAPFRVPDDAAWASGRGCYVLGFTGFGPAWLNGIPW